MYKLLIICGAAILTPISVYIVCLAIQPIPPEWTGFGANTAYGKKTLWDWLELILIPAALGLIGWLYARSEKVRNENEQKEKERNNLMMETSKYFSKLVENGLLSKELTDELRTSIMIRILLIIQRLDGSRKGQIFQHIYLLRLFDPSSEHDQKKPKLNIRGSNFNNSILDKINLKGSILKGVYFVKSSLVGANFEHAKLIACDFKKSNFKQTIFENTDLRQSYFDFCWFSKNNFSTSKIEGCSFNYAIFYKCKFNQSQKKKISNSKCVINLRASYVE